MVSAQQEQRRVKSEHGSPLLSPASNFDQPNGHLPPLDLSNLAGDYSFLQNLDGFSTIPDQEQPIFSAGLCSTSIDWSHYDGLDFNNENFAASSYSQAPSFTGYDFSSVDQPALTTTSTSGEISEVEDFGTLSDTTASRPALLNNQYGSEFDNSDFGGDLDGYRLSTASSYIGMPQAQMLASNNVEALDMDTFLKGVATTPNGYAGTNRGLPNTDYDEDDKTGQTPSPFDDNFHQLATEEENDAFWMNGFTSNVAISNGPGDIPEENWTQ
jgi:hypothetical protein